MKTLNIKTLLFGLFFATTFVVKAQEAREQYEYAEVSLNVDNFKILVAYPDKESEVIEPGVKLYRYQLAHEAVLKEVGQKLKEGWIIVNQAYFGQAGYPVYFLKRKKQ